MRCLLDEKDGPPAAKVRVDGLRPGALRQHVDEAAIHLLKSVRHNGRWSGNAILVELDAVVVHAQCGALQDDVDDVHDLALFEVVAGRQVDQWLHLEQVDLLQCG